MQTTRTATTVWQGDLMSGSGEVSSGTTEHLRNLPVSWPSRTEEAQGRTSPEELLAAAHSACFSMAMSNRLAKSGLTVERLEVRADVTFEKRENGWAVASSRLTVKGRVPGSDESSFREAAEFAKDGCPISQALKGNVELSVQASLES